MINRTLKTLLVTTVILVAPYSFATPKNYLGFNLGSSVVTSKSKLFVDTAVITDNKKKPKSGFITDVYAGMYLTDSLAGEIELAYSPNYKIKDDSFRNGSSTTTVKTKIKSFVGFVNAKYHFNNFNTNLKPFVFLGLGASSNKVAKVHEERISAPYTYGSKTKTNFAWQIGAGALYKVSERVGVTLTYAYRDLGKYESKKTILEINEDVRTNPVRGRLKTSNFMAGVQFSF